VTLNRTRLKSCVDVKLHIASVASTHVNGVDTCGIIVFYVDWFVTSAINDMYKSVISIQSLII